MTISEFKSALESNPGETLRFILPDDDEIPLHAHITEVGRVDKSFIDCGGTVRKISTCQLQAWVADDTEHRLTPAKLARVLDIAAPILGGDDLPMEIEYEDCSITQFPVLGVESSGGELIFRLGEKHTDCLAKEHCLPPGTGLRAGNSGCCS